MWIFYAIGSSFFAGITAILAKCGIKKTDSNVATAIRTVVVLLFSWLMVLITGTWGEIRQIDGRTLLFLILSGLATGASWLCYFHALQKGDINKVVPIDKSSTVLSILLAFIFLHEGISGKKIIFVLLIGIGTMMMITKKDIKTDSEKKSGGWLIYAVLSAVFASLTSILGKIGIEGIDSNLGTAIRTTVVLLMAWLMVFVTQKQKEINKIEKKELCFICLSGLATGASWLFYYRVGMDALSPGDRLKMEAARSIREDFLHQNSFHEIDTYTSLEKQHNMMRLVLAFYDAGLDALKQGADINDIVKLPVREQIGRYKYTKEDQLAAEYEKVTRQLAAETAELLGKEGL